MPIQLDEATVRSFFYVPSPNQSLVSFNLGLWFGLRPDVAVAALQDIISFVATGRIKVAVGHVLPLHAAAEAHRMLEERRSTGKIVLKPWSAS